MKFIKSFSLALLLFIQSAHTYNNLAGIRDVQIRSNQVVTVWLGYLSTTDSLTLYNPENYIIRSPNDAAYADTVHPVRVSRFSKGSRSANGPADWRVLKDNLMHLEVAAPFKPGKRYVVYVNHVIPRDLPRTMQFNMEDTPNPGFKLNQVGYTNTAETKLIYLSSYLGDGEPVDLSPFKTFDVVDNFSRNVVMTGPVKKVSDKDRHGKDALYVLDISCLKAEGEFYVRIDGLGRSYVFKNGTEAGKSMFNIITRGLYFQRCGIELIQPYAEKWAHPMSHNQVYVTPENIVHPWHLNPDPSNPESGDYYVPDGPREIHGGHHDAGDYDTRLTHFAVSEKIMTLYEMLPEKFSDGQSFIPESNNGIPDILDEAAWSLLHLEYLMDYSGQVHGEYGAVPPGMESHTHPPKFPVTGDGDRLPYYTRKATPYTTFCGAALFAQAARVYQPFDFVKADKYLERAEAAYQYAVKHRKEKWDPENPDVLPLDWEEVYDQDKLNSAWTWAAGQLYVTTGKNDYWKAFKKRCFSVENMFQQHPWTSLFPVIAHDKNENHIKSVTKLRKQLLEAADTALDSVKANGRNGYQAACRNHGDWGWANPITNMNVFIRAFYLTKAPKYRDAVAASVDFTLGMNPSEFSWMTGAGTVYPMDPLSANSKYDGVEEPQPGIVIFGPGDNYMHNQNYLYPNPHEMGFYRRIADVWGYVPGCEYVVDEQQTNMLVGVGILLENLK